jgi:hypothetical protein
VAINLLLERSISAPQRWIAVNLFAKTGIGVSYAMRGGWAEGASHTWFYVNWMAKVPKILQKESDLLRFCRMLLKLT